MQEPLLLRRSLVDISLLNDFELAYLNVTRPRGKVSINRQEWSMLVSDTCSFDILRSGHCVCFFVCLIDCLFVCLLVLFFIGWLIDRLIGWWMDGWMDGWMDSFIHSCMHAFIHSFIHSSFVLLIVWLVDWLFVLLIGLWFVCLFFFCGNSKVGVSGGKYVKHHL